MIIAVDFDGILCKNEFPKIGPANYEIIVRIRRLIDRGHEVILWTTRNGQELEDAIDWCGDYGLHFCNVNGPAPSNANEYSGVYEKESRKIYADLYIDDHDLCSEMFDRVPLVESIVKLIDDLLRKGEL